MAGSGIYDSPVSQNALNRTQTGLADQYATGKSTLAGQKMQAIGSIDQQKIGYLQNLASMQYSRQQAQESKKSSIFGSLGGLGGSLMAL
jgi:translation elongation factor EF-1alpha